MKKITLIFTYVWFAFVASQTCDYKCIPQKENQVEILGTIFECVNGKICNNYPDLTWQPCIECTDLFICDPVNADAFYMDGNLLYCPDGYTCNAKYIPCEPCVLKLAPKSTTTTTVIPATDIPYIESDCNENSTLCIPGRPGSEVYYRCHNVWWWYERVVKDCKDKSQDEYCSQDVNICIT